MSKKVGGRRRRTNIHNLCEVFFARQVQKRPSSRGAEDVVEWTGGGGTLPTGVEGDFPGLGKLLIKGFEKRFLSSACGGLRVILVEKMCSVKDGLPPGQGAL